VDNWGDFDIDGLKAGTMYKVVFDKTGYYSKTIEVYLNTDKFIGTVSLVKKM
jgi:hypothetical protein